MALLAGIALGANRPLVFVGPIPVRSPSLAARTHTLIEPIPVAAIGFQLQTLGAKAADRRARREEVASRKASISVPQFLSDAYDQTPQKLEQARRIEASSLESLVLEALAKDPGVTTLGGESATARNMHGRRDLMIDALVWVDGAAPFNPIPVEVKFHPSRAAHEQAFSVLAASGSALGVLIVGDTAATGEPQVDERDGRFLITLSAQSILRQSSLFSRWVRAVRNEIAHGGRPLGEI